MPRAATGTTPRLYFARESKRWRQPDGSRAHHLLLEKRGEHDDRTSGAELAQLLTLTDCPDSVTPWLENIERAERGGSTQSVGVRLDHREESNA
jgi:hypothetical protein